MPPHAQIGDRLRREAVLDDEMAGARIARIERFLKMSAMEQRRVDRLLQAFPIEHVAQEEDQLPLVLLVAAGRAEGEPRAVVAYGEARRERRVGRRPGARLVGSPSSSQNICARVLSAKPSPGTTGEDCSQPPEGVAETMLPKRSMMSRCTVSPRFSVRCAMVGSPAPAPPAEALVAPRSALARAIRA